MPDPNSPQPAFVQIADDLRARITSGEIAVGTRLQPQRELATKYHVATGTLQSALRLLADEGVISSGSTRGTFVLRAPGEPEPSPEYTELAEQVSKLAERLADVEERLGIRGEGQGA